MSNVSPDPAIASHTFFDEMSNLARWSRQNPVAVALGVCIVATLAYFFGFVHLFTNSALSALQWAWYAWNPQQNQEHSKLVPLISLFLAWYHRAELLRAPRSRSNAGLVVVASGIGLFLLSARCLEPRMALMSIPLLLFGSILFLWGKAVARILFFPCAFLIFLIPFGAVEQATFKLQFIITGIVGVFANFVGIHIHAVGTTLSAQDSSFHFEVAEGCSGIRSITALTMLAAVYSHLTQNELWKKTVIIACSAVFAIIGNVGRIFTILLVAKLFNADIAGGEYHEISGYLIFPFAIMAMIGVSRLLNMDYHRISTQAQPPATTGSSRHNDYDY